MERVRLAGRRAGGARGLSADQAAAPQAPLVLGLHGLTGSPAGLAPLADALRGAGATVETPLLPGHGTHWRDLRASGWREWMAAADDALQRLRRAGLPVVVGLSMGGLLALHLAQTRPNDVAGLVLINPFVHLAAGKSRALAVVQWLGLSIRGVGNDVARPHQDEHAYPRLPLWALAQAVELQRRVRADLPAVSAPTLVFTSRQDHVVDPRNSRIVVDGIAAVDVEQVWLERSYHVATLDYDADLVAARTLQFARRVTAAQAESGAT